MQHSASLILLADAPDALVEVCGISLLERHLRIAQQLDFVKAVVLSATPEAIRGELARPSWPRAKVLTEVQSRPAGPITPGMLRQPEEPNAKSWLVLPAASYCDARLIAALAEKSAPCLLVDSQAPAAVRAVVENLPATARGRLCGPALLTAELLSQLSPDQPLVDQLRRAVDAGTIETIDAATEPDYIVSMRRHRRPLCFPASSVEAHKLAERIIIDTAQKGTLDLPAYAHAFPEDWIIARLCRTRITPNQITLAGLALGLAATWAYASGHFVLGVVIALIFGVVDGLDGKQARIKVEMTRQGKWEHHLDYVIENSWWAALAWGLWRSAQLPAAWYFFALLYGSQVLDAIVRRKVKLATGRLMDDVGPFDRLFRLIGARRNIYIWILAIGLCSGHFVQAYRFISIWGFVTLLVHSVRALAIIRAAPAGAQSV